MAAASSSSSENILENGCLVPRGTIHCPRGIDFCYTVDGIALVSDGYTYNKRKRKENRISPRVVFGVLHPAPLPFNVSIDEHSCQYHVVTHSVSGRDMLRVTSARPNPPELKKLTDTNWTWKLRNWFEIKLADYFIRTPENFFNASEVRERDRAFNKMFGLPDVCRFCVYKNKNPADRSPEDQLDKVRYWEIMQHPLGKKNEVMTPDGSFLPVSQWYRPDMEIQYEHLDTILRFIYSKVVTLDGVVDVEVDPGTETATLYTLKLSTSGIFRCGDSVEGTKLVDEFKTFVKSIFPSKPCVFKDITGGDVPQLFKHGIRVLHEAVYLQRDIRKRKRAGTVLQSQNERAAAQVMVTGMKQPKLNQQQENREDEKLIAFGRNMLSVVPILINASFNSLEKSDIEHVVAGCTVLGNKENTESAELIVGECRTTAQKQQIGEKLVAMLQEHLKPSHEPVDNTLNENAASLDDPVIGVSDRSITVPQMRHHSNVARV